MIELSIVMIIIGLIIAGGITAYTPSMRQALKNKNETIVRHAVEALVGYGGAHKYLPSTISNTGVVNSVQDGQKNTLQYAYDTNLTSANAVCNRDSTNLTVQVLKSDGSVNFSVSNVAFVIWSMGYDGATSNAKTAGAIAAAATYTVPLYQEGTTSDDLVGWATMSELKAAAGCGGSSLKILASSMPVGIVGSTYGTVTFTPDGGLAPYYWCVEFPDTTRSGKLTFTATAGVTPATAFGSCTAPASVGSTLTMTGNSAFVSTDQGGPYDLVVYLKDTNAYTVSRRFSLYVNQ
ncbi:MAG: hypothetical protein HQL98_01810 [Magnetococcales bacterium]|nr:hypothetical protein [Magnetococcales bacterium]